MTRPDSVLLPGHTAMSTIELASCGGGLHDEMEHSALWAEEHLVSCRALREYCLEYLGCLSINYPLCACKGQSDSYRQPPVLCAGRCSRH